MMSRPAPPVFQTILDEASAQADAEPSESPFLPLAVEIVGVGVGGGWQGLPGIEKRIRAAVAALGAHPRVAPFLPAEGCIALSTDAQVRKLNSAWRAKDRPTNVLSFPTPPGQPTEPGIPPFVGDVVLALETVRREADDLGIPVEHHVQHLTVHGLLHLFGFDHEEDAMAREMETIETQVLASLGIPDPYAGNDAQDDKR